MRILVIEKDPDIQTSLGDVLESDGHEVILTNNVTSARQVLNKQKIDIILADKFTVGSLDWMKKYNKIKIIIMNTFRCNAENYLFLQKPFDLEKLLELIRK